MSDSGKAYEWVDKQDQAALKASPRVLAAESYLAGITSRDAEVESLQAELAEARAVIEQVGAEATRHSEVVDGCVRVETAYVTQVLSAYHAAPSSALDAAYALPESIDGKFCWWPNVDGGGSWYPHDFGGGACANCYRPYWRES